VLYNIKKWGKTLDIPIIVDGVADTFAANTNAYIECTIKLGEVIMYPCAE
jgi:hypothetical protein